MSFSTKICIPQCNKYCLSFIVFTDNNKNIFLRDFYSTSIISEM